MVKTIDNFLKVSEFKFLLDKIVFSSDFQWYLNRGVSYEKIIESNANHFAFAHTFYEMDDNNYGKTTSQCIDLISSITEKLDMKILLRSKANLYYKSNKIVYHDDHIDFPFSHKGALLNLNTNDGGTIIDGTEYKSVENQIILFDPSKPHSSFAQTDAELRFNVIVNYL